MLKRINTYNKHGTHNRGKSGGRKKGTVNKKGTGSKHLFRVLTEILVEDNLAKFKEELYSLKGKEFVEAFISLYKIRPNEINRIDAQDELLDIFKNRINGKS